MRYDDDDDDFDIANRRSGVDENASSIGVIGFIFSALGIGLILVVVVLWIFLDKEDAVQRNVAFAPCSRRLQPQSRRRGKSEIGGGELGEWIDWFARP